MNDTVFVRDDLQTLCKAENAFGVMRTIDGEIFRDKEGRRTLRFEHEGRSYFLKYHSGVGWAEILKNLLQLRQPIISARNEWQAIKTLHKAGVDTMTLAAYGERGCNPARRESFVVTDDLNRTMSLEDLGQQWQSRPPTVHSKRTLINKLAQISRQMHGAGLNHRDYYLCHFLLDERFAADNQIDESTRLFLIDLHRAQKRHQVPRRWLVKDLGSLYFSAQDVPMTRRDKLRFISAYSDQPWRQALKSQAGFWQQVERRARQLQQKWRRQNG